ncbi:hypothetical protein BDY17DRAFT_311085 [Neohortaea acidophila]|uniref:U4/U6 snRNA-associated-splicing factor PRP24 n=1 Tax=Neohortaea acidophila TaxID=245834 RepID=A0A6A6PRA0_9PEZI|nr:uncharacterized protein BDY17DRAFT_311085 [Neohortaea acidophila]KAF2482640.1 hypothetical protein BDY17DRAFT_311085 [Neohortaea acidophila]
MNINALLSPSDSPARDDSSSSASPPAKAATPYASRKRSALNREVSQEESRSPESDRSTAAFPSASSHAFPGPSASRGTVPNFRPLHPPPTSHPAASSSAPPPHGGVAQTLYQPITSARRTSSTPQMETLADLASMQRQQTTRPLSANNFRSSVPSTSRSPALNPQPPPIRPQDYLRNSRKSVVDLTMSEAAAQTPPPRAVASNVLSEAQTQRVTDLLTYLADNSYAYDSHVELINILHAAFIAHAAPSADGAPPDQGAPPPDFPLLTELRQAREAMDTRFAVGEDLWDDWLSDEIRVATSSEERLAITELFQKAVADEPASVKLWQMYAGWVWINYVACNTTSSPDPASHSRWTEEDKALCKDLFTRHLVIDVLEQAIASTQWRVDESHVVWNRYAELVQEDFPTTPKPGEIERLRGMYVARLQFPHATWEETSQMFWSIVSKYESGNWEAIMAEVQSLTGPAKAQMSQREPHESNLQRAIDAGNRDDIFNQFTQYIQWERNRERKQKNRSALDKELRSALYERALLRFPTHTEWWIDYVDFVISSGSSTPVLPLIERGTRHCPWSGELWARRILQLAVDGRPHHEIEATKHRATNSGLLDVGGMEEMVKVLQQWCSFLRRHAFATASSEDDIDTAEVGITMALEDIQQAGKKIYGKDFQGDPLFRLEQIQIKFLSEARRFEDARKIYQNLVKTQKNSFDFWSKYYNWELWIWGYDRIKDRTRVETPDNGPDKASAVLQEALSQREIDWPEKVLDMYINHFQQHESGQRLRSAIIEAREVAKHLAWRKAAEAAEAAQGMEAAQQAASQAQLEAKLATAQGGQGGGSVAGDKRKRSDEPPFNGHSEKKTKTEEQRADPSAPGNPAHEPSASSSAQVKRDREHNTITISDLPADVEELDVKKFFRDIGAPVSINIRLDEHRDTATATVEFEAQEDVLAARTRDGKMLKGKEVRIQSGTQSTLYVANYPPEHDELAIRKLFESYGEILSVRFPSLKYNNRRRFCYVQFLTSDMAKAAEAAMDGKMLDGSHKLLAKISDPEAKKQRAGAQAEGRELFVKNIERTAPDEEIKAFFEKYGTVVSMNLVKLVNGKKTGTAFVIYATADGAHAALEADNKPFHDRILHVELASAKGRAAPLDRAKKENIIVSQAHSASPEPDANGRRSSDASMHSSNNPADESYKTARERKIAIFNLPDTVNDARIRSAMEEHGPILQIQLRRRDNGAIVEFKNVQDAFNVRQGVDCAALGADVKTGDVADLLTKVKQRQDGDGQQPSSSAVQRGSGHSAATAGDMRPPSIVRPTQRGGRRGGLGFKRGGPSAVGAGRSSGETTTVADAADAQQQGKPAKSNDDFRNMFIKSKEAAEESNAGKE